MCPQIATSIRDIDTEVGTLRDDLLCGSPLFAYRRYDVSPEPEDVESLLPKKSPQTAQVLAEMDAPGNMQALADIGDAGDIVHDQHFPTAFNLPPE